MPRSIIRTVVISEDAQERATIVQTLDGIAGIEVVAEVTLICQMGKQAGHVDADAVILDIDRYPMAGTLSLVQAKATFPNTPILVLVRDPAPQFPTFLKASGASCCIDKDDHEYSAQLLTALQAAGAAGTGTPRHTPTRLEQSSFRGLSVPQPDESANALGKVCSKPRSAV